MPSLTDGAIRQALKRVDQSGKQESLVDGEGRGTGRLVITLKPMPMRVTAEWMAQQWHDGKRIKKKLGAYPSMSLAQAREVFKRDFADMIQKGRSIKIAGDTRPGTVADLLKRPGFDASTLTLHHLLTHNAGGLLLGVRSLSYAAVRISVSQMFPT